MYGNMKKYHDHLRRLQKVLVEIFVRYLGEKVILVQLQLSNVVLAAPRMKKC